MSSKLIILVVLSLFLNGCFLFEDGPEVPFYERKIGHDVWSIPLIEPCYLGSTTGIEGEWYLSDCFGTGSNTVTHANVIDSVIISYEGKDYLKPENNDTTWIISIPSVKQEFTFPTREKFDAAVIKFTDKPITFFEIKKLYNKLTDNGYLEWYPDEYKK